MLKFLRIPVICWCAVVPLAMALPLAIWPRLWPSTFLYDDRRVDDVAKLIVLTGLAIVAAALGLFVPRIRTLMHSAKISEKRRHQLEVRTAELARLNESHLVEMAERMRAEEALNQVHEEALRHSERRYHTLAEIAPVGIFHTDAVGANVYVNETWCQITGLNLTQGIFDGWVHAIHPEDRQRVLEAWARTTTQNADFKSEFRFQRPDGTIIWVLSQAKAQRNSVGAIIGYVGTVTDISDRKQAELMQLQLAAIVSSSEDAIIGLTPAGVITSWNAGAEDIFGYSSAKAIGQNISMLVPPDRCEESRAILEKLQQGQRVEHFETVRQRKDGRLIAVALTVSPIKDSAGKIIGVSKIAQDISERKRAETAIEAHHMTIEAANQELALTNGRLAELCQTSERFVDDVSHEFRTPLSVIKGYSEILREGLAGPLVPKQVQFMQLIIDRTHDLAQMVDDLLDTSKLRAGSLRVDRKVCDIPAIFASVRQMIDSRASAGNITLIEQIEPGLPQVFADAGKVSRVIVNLAVNAIKFSPEGSRVVLWARVHPTGDVHIGVTDEGPGISPENLAVIFQRFRQIGEIPSNTKGFGLGLNIAKELVALNLGQMNVASELHIGSTFSFTLPINEPRIILDRLFEHLEALKTPSGQLAMLRVLPDAPGAIPEQLRGFLASTAHPGDVILTAPDGASLILFGYSSDPANWQKRLVEARANFLPYSTSQRLCGFSTQLVGTWEYPNKTTEATAAVLDELLGVCTHA